MAIAFHQAVLFVASSVGFVVLYAIVVLATFGLWWYCFGERHPKLDLADSVDQMIDSMEFPESKWQEICGWAWPIFMLPLIVVAAVRLAGWKLVRNNQGDLNGKVEDKQKRLPA